MRSANKSTEGVLFMKAKRFTALLLTVACVLFAISASAAGKLTVTQEAFFVRSFLSYFAGEVYAEVSNTGNKPVAFNGGLLELFDPNGDSIESSNLYSCYPEVLEPGETGYLYVSQSVEDATKKEDIDDYLLTVTGKSESKKKTIRLKSEGTFGEYQMSEYFSSYATNAMITNTSGESAKNITVVYALFTADDKLMYVNSTVLYNATLPPDQTIEVNADVSSSLVEAWEAEGIAPAKIVTIAYVEKEV